MIVKKSWMKLTSEELAKFNENATKRKEPENHDVIITELVKKTEVELQKDGTLKETITYEKVLSNITKKINETARKLKGENMDELLKLIDEVHEVEEI